MPTEITTTSNAFRVPTSANTGPDFATGILDLATDADGMWLQGTLAAQPAAAKRGREYYATDTGGWYKDSGGGWVRVATLDGGGHVPLSQLSGITGSQLSGSAGITGSQLSATAGITFAQLAANARLAVVGVSGTYAANNGDLVEASASGTSFTVTLPMATAGAQVGVIVVGSNVGTVTVAASGGAIIDSLGAINVASIPLAAPGAKILLKSDGVNWFAISGERDTGWVSLTLPGSWTVVGYVPAIRIVGDQCRLRGAASNSTGGNSTFSVSISSSATPASTVFLPVLSNATVPPNGLPQWATISGTTLVAGGGTPNGSYIGLDGLSYSLV